MGSTHIGKISESDFEKGVILGCKRQFGWSFKCRGSSIQRRGMVDVIICLPTTAKQTFGEVVISEDGPYTIKHQGETITKYPDGVIFMELKVEDGRVGAHQTQVMEEIQKAGGRAVITKLRENGFIETWEIGKKREQCLSTFLLSNDFTSGFWLRKILETIPHERAVFRIPLPEKPVPPSTPSDT